MKKIAFFGFMASVMTASGVAFGDAASLTTQGYVDAGLKAVYKAVDNIKADKDSVYTKTEIDNAGYLTEASIAGKADADSVYTKTEIDNAGYLTEASIAGKADADSVYTKTEIDNAGYLTEASIAGKADADSVYTKTEIDNAGYITNANVSAGSQYVYTSNGWNALTIEDTFDPEFDFGG